MFEFLAQAAGSADISIPNVPGGDVTKIAIGGVIVWLFKSGYLDKFWIWRKEDKQETREEAKEGPEREVKLLRTSLEETKLTMKGIIAEMTEQREKRHNCEVEVAEMRTELKHAKEEVGRVLVELKNEREEKTKLKQEIADQKQEIDELRQQIKAQVGDWKLLKKDVQAVQDHQDQQSK
jgi:chromosome segregation ATPase